MHPILQVLRCVSVFVFVSVVAVGTCEWQYGIRILPSPDPSSVYMIPFPDRGHHSTVTQSIVKSSLNIDSDLVKRG